MSLKEIKNRIASVKSTRKITAAMKMVSSVKLRKAQQGVLAVVPYVEQLDGILRHLVSTGKTRPGALLTGASRSGRTALVAVSSNTSLCGGFNSNIIKHTQALAAQLLEKSGKEPLIFPVGQKIGQSLAKTKLQLDNRFLTLMDKREYSGSAALADHLVELFTEGAIDKVVLVYTHFRSAGSQEITDSVLLPMAVETDATEASLQIPPDCILEPSADDLLQELLPMVLRMKVHSALLDSFASEQAARVIAMQAATDNADKLTGELTMQYNKQRQQAITNELLDLAGGTQNQ